MGLMLLFYVYFQKQQSLTEFINFIKVVYLIHHQEQRVVECEALASRFEISSDQVVKRIQTLLDEKEIQGFMDDRGKFVFITDEDLRNISQHIVNKGRCSLNDLSKNFGAILKM
uniref:DDRGK domain-containing protein 1 n=1 Tax=Henneguya salminicola TaxID=69463 RepID=A0A6G3MM16_HENSL